MIDRVYKFELILFMYYMLFRLRLCWFYCSWPKDGQWHDSRSVEPAGWSCLPSGYLIALFTLFCISGIGWVFALSECHHNKYFKYIYFCFSDGSWHHFRHWRIPDMAWITRVSLQVVWQAKKLVHWMWIIFIFYNFFFTDQPLCFGSSTNCATPWSTSIPPKSSIFYFTLVHRASYGSSIFRLLLLWHCRWVQCGAANCCWALRIRPTVWPIAWWRDCCGRIDRGSICCWPERIMVVSKDIVIFFIENCFIKFEALNN